MSANASTLIFMYFKKFSQKSWRRSSLRPITVRWYSSALGKSSMTPSPSGSKSTKRKSKKKKEKKKQKKENKKKKKRKKLVIIYILYIYFIVLNNLPKHLCMTSVCVTTSNNGRTSTDKNPGWSGTVSQYVEISASVGAVIERGK